MQEEIILCKDLCVCHHSSSLYAKEKKGDEICLYSIFYVVPQRLRAQFWTADFVGIPILQFISCLTWEKLFNHSEFMYLLENGIILVSPKGCFKNRLWQCSARSPVKIMVAVSYEVLSSRNVPFVKRMPCGVERMELSWELHRNSARRLPKTMLVDFFKVISFSLSFLPFFLIHALLLNHHLFILLKMWGTLERAKFRVRTETGQEWSLPPRIWKWRWGEDYRKHFLMTIRATGAEHRSLGIQRR